MFTAGWVQGRLEVFLINKKQRFIKGAILGGGTFSLLRSTKNSPT